MLVLTVQDCIKVVTVSCQCFFLLFMIVLRWGQFHVRVFIDYSGLH